MVLKTEDMIFLDALGSVYDHVEPDLERTTPIVDTLHRFFLITYEYRSGDLYDQVDERLKNKGLIRVEGNSIAFSK